MELFLAEGLKPARPNRPQGQRGAARARGFTLIELMITAAIVALLAAVAYPSYTSHVRKGYRAAAQSYLMDLAQKQGQYLLDNRIYAGSEVALNATRPTDVNKYYDVGFTVNNTVAPYSFTITATPKAGTSQASDGALSINQAGQKTPTDKW